MCDDGGVLCVKKSEDASPPGCPGGEDWSRMNSASIDGQRLKAMLARLGVKQKEVCEATGVSKFNVSRWCASGEHRVKVVNLEALARLLGRSVQDLMEECRARHRDESPYPGGRNLTQAEAEWLATYRALSPLQQAKVRLAVEEEVTRLRASGEKRPQ